VVNKVGKHTIEEIRIEITAFLLQHTLPFSLAPELVTLFQNLIGYGEKAIQQLSLSSTTATQITKNVISKSYQEEIFKDLKNNLFALSFDESSDQYGPAYLCTHARYIKNGTFENKLLSLIEISENPTGENLYKLCFKELFSGQKEEYLRKNLVGVCTDRGSNMLSKKDKGLTNRIQEQYNQVFAANDYSHIFNSICKHSLKKFAQEPINLVKEICNHFSRSSF